MIQRIRTPFAPILLLLTLAAAAQPQGRGERDRLGASGRSVPVPTTAYDSKYQPLPRVDTLIINATILDGGGGRIDQGAVLVREGRIVAIGPSAAGQSATTLIDARGAWLTPGLIDIHSHNGTYVAPLTANDAQYSDVAELSSFDRATDALDE